MTNLTTTDQTERREARSRTKTVAASIVAVVIVVAFAFVAGWAAAAAWAEEPEPQPDVCLEALELADEAIWQYFSQAQGYRENGVPEDVQGHSDVEGLIYGWYTDARDECRGAETSSTRDALLVGGAP